MKGNDLPNPRETVALYKSQGINRMRIYQPDRQVLQALRGSNIELTLGVRNEDLQRLTNIAAATTWVQRNVLNYFPDVKIKYVAVGNEVTPVNQNSRYAPFVVPAMTNIYNAIMAAGLWGQVQVSTSIDTGVMGTSYPPSAGSFRSDVLWFMNPVLGFLSDTQANLLVSVYPYFSRVYEPQYISLPYALFTKTSPEFIDPGNNLPYYNLFDAQIDALHSAMERVLGTSYGAMFNDPYLASRVAAKKTPRTTVSETGWPKAGGRQPKNGLLGVDETIDNACTYYQNVIRHVKNGTPKVPGVPIETYLFAMFNENQKTPPGIEQNFGLFYPNKTPACTINFRE
ncbi:putative glucan endo-1 [Ranunculus cassubicifolius]